MKWVYLLTAIGLEVAGTTAMKLSDGLSRLIPSILMFVFYFSCFGVFAFAVKKFDVSTAYAIWSGIGMAAISVIGILVFKEHMNLLKAVSILLIIAGVIGLNFSGVSH